MKCPSCPDVTLAMTNREGIEIDYCPSCRGVWLDRGELDKIIERSANEPAAPPRQQSYEPSRAHYDDDDDRRYREHGEHGKHGYRKRKRGLLGDLFDFD